MLVWNDLSIVLFVSCCDAIGYSPHSRSDHVFDYGAQKNAQRGIWLGHYISVDQLDSFICPSYKLVCYLLGIEPWTFVQKLGDAVFIPAGCPHQVRNLKVNNFLKWYFFPLYLCCMHEEIT